MGFTDQVGIRAVLLLGIDGACLKRNKCFVCEVNVVYLLWDDQKDGIHGSKACEVEVKFIFEVNNFSLAFDEVVPSLYYLNLNSGGKKGPSS